MTEMNTLRQSTDRQRGRVQVERGTERLRDIQIVGQRDWKTFRHYNKEIEGHSSIETKRFMENFKTLIILIKDNFQVIMKKIIIQK